MRRAAKWLLLAAVIGEVYSRGGRELLLGPREQAAEWGVGETFKMWVDLPVGVTLWVDPTGHEITHQGQQIGVVAKFEEGVEVRDQAGYPVRIQRVYVEVLRDRLGWPINVAMAQVVEFTRASLLSA